MNLRRFYVVSILLALSRISPRIALAGGAGERIFGRRSAYRIGPRVWWDHVKAEVNDQTPGKDRDGSAEPAGSNHYGPMS